jgi:hypothetical protein
MKKLLEKLQPFISSAVGRAMLASGCFFTLMMYSTFWSRPGKQHEYFWEEVIAIGIGTVISGIIVYMGTKRYYNRRK